MRKNILIIVSLLFIATQQIRSINFEEAKENSEETFMVVEEMPEFEGGQDSLITFIVKNTSYPIEAIEKKIEGRCFVQFTIDTDGNINDIKVIRGINPILDAEAIRVVESMPKWKPGKQEGKLVKVSYILPIVFKLK